MAKAPKPPARKSTSRPAAPARPRAVAGARAAKRTTAGAAPVRPPRPAPKKKDDDDTAVTRVTDETAVRGNETRVERVVERAPKPSIPDVDRAAGRGRYVYCIIRASQPLKFGAIGMDEQWAEVYTINFKDMAAVISDIPLAPLDSTRENVLAHERVNETVMRDHTVIPMSFGTIFKTREDIVELLRSAYDAFGDVLNKMQNKLEFGLKVLWERDVIVKEIEEEDEDIHRL
ncbi:MAG TPA: GvpL/GvpF family gas vesicle protein, partial [Vicinamibacterales bacterium]